MEKGESFWWPSELCSCTFPEQANVLVQAGGKGSDGKRRILDIQPEELHHRLPLFLGSPEDIDELESYGDVQQIGSKKYTV